MKLLKSIMNAVFSLDAALVRTVKEQQLQKAVEIVAREHNVNYVPALPVLGVGAEIVITVGGLSICGITGAKQMGLTPRILARALEPKIRELTRGIDWEFVNA